MAGGASRNGRALDLAIMLTLLEAARLGAGAENESAAVTRLAKTIAYRNYFTLYFENRVFKKSGASIQKGQLTNRL